MGCKATIDICYVFIPFLFVKLKIILFLIYSSIIVVIIVVIVVIVVVIIVVIVVVVVVVPAFRCRIERAQKNFVCQTILALI